MSQYLSFSFMKAGADPKALCTWYNHKRKVNVDMCTVLGLAVSVCVHF